MEALIFVSIIVYGKYDDKETEIVYAGTIYEDALVKLKSYTPPQGHIFRFIQYWQNGELIQTETIENPQ